MTVLPFSLEAIVSPGGRGENEVQAEFALQRSSRMSDVVSLTNATGTIDRAEHCLAIPPQFLCPITMEIMEFPMRTPHGHAFERDAIRKWLAQSRDGLCPLTRRKLSYKSLSRDYQMMSQIHMWRVYHNMTEPKQMFRLTFGQEEAKSDPICKPKVVSPPSSSIRKKKLTAAQLLAEALNETAELIQQYEDLFGSVVETDVEKNEFDPVTTLN
jgi:U-box domain